MAAHIEPTQSWWELGRGLRDNIRSIITALRNRDLVNAYELDVVLWIRALDQPVYVPLLMNTGTVNMDSLRNNIEITVSREELGQYGIAPRFGTFELPAKLTNFSAGVRYFEVPLLHLPGGRLSINTTSFVATITRLQERPFIGTITSRVLERFGDVSWEDVSDLLTFFEESDMLPETVSLSTIDTLWKVTDRAPDVGGSQKILPLFPALFDELQLNVVSFLSQEYKTGEDPKATLVVVLLKQVDDLDAVVSMNTNILKQIQDIDTEYDYLSFNATGPGIISSEINEITGDANTIIGPSIFIIIIGVLFVSFRKPSYVLIAMLALVISTLWLFGTMALLGIPFNVIAVALVPIILGLGVDYSVHLFHTYRSELQKNKTPGQAIKEAINGVGTAMFLAMITTVIAFMSFLTASVPPVRDFGILLALGVIYTFITALTLSATLRFVVDRKKKIRIDKQTSFLSITNIMKKTSQTVVCHQKKILGIMILLTILAGIGAVNIETGFDFNQFIPQDTPALSVRNSIAEDFPYSSQDQEYILIEGDVATVAALTGIAETQDNLDDDTYVARNSDGSVKVTSISTLIKQAVDNNESLRSTFNIRNGRYIPDTDRDVRAFYDYFFQSDEYTQDVKNVLSQDDSTYDAAIIRVYIARSLQTKEGNINEELQLLQQELNDDITTYGDATAVATGELIISLTITNSLTESQAVSTIMSLILAAVVLIIAYRNPSLGLIAMIPVTISIVWILGTMYYIGYTLNILTITVTSITIGIGIDYAIHATERFRSTADRTGDTITAVCETISHTGGALLIAALTTILGFGILVFAPIPPQQQFGLILAITILYSFLTSVLLLPIVLLRWANWRKKKKGYIISQKHYSDKEKNDFESCACENNN